MPGSRSERKKIFDAGTVRLEDPAAELPGVLEPGGKGVEVVEAEHDAVFPGLPDDAVIPEVFHPPVEREGRHPRMASPQFVLHELVEKVELGVDGVASGRSPASARRGRERRPARGGPRSGRRGRRGGGRSGSPPILSARPPPPSSRRASIRGGTGGSCSGATGGRGGRFPAAIFRPGRRASCSPGSTVARAAGSARRSRRAKRDRWARRTPWISIGRGFRLKRGDAITHGGWSQRFTGRVSVAIRS